jgi:hypothetical protein
MWPVPLIFMWWYFLFLFLTDFVYGNERNKV